MSDVFISYARSTANAAQSVASALRGIGYDVWLDDEIPAHRAYADVIEERLKAAWGLTSEPLSPLVLPRSDLTPRPTTHLLQC